MDAIDATVQASPIFGPILAVSWMALAYVFKGWRDESRARVEDAKGYASAIVQIATDNTQAMTAVATAVEAVKDSVEEVDTTLDQIRSDIPRRNR